MVVRNGKFVFYRVNARVTGRVVSGILGPRKGSRENDRVTLFDDDSDLCLYGDTRKHTRRSRRHVRRVCYFTFRSPRDSSDANGRRNDNNVTTTTTTFEWGFSGRERKKRFIHRPRLEERVFPGISDVPTYTGRGGGCEVFAFLH